MFWLVRKMWRLVSWRASAVLLLAVAAGEGWLTLRPKPAPMDDHRADLSEELARKVAESLPVPPVGRPTLVVAPFERDPTGAVTQAVRHAIERVDRYAVQPASFLEILSREVGMHQQLSPEEATCLALEDFPGEFLLAGRVETLSSRSDGDNAAAEIALVPRGMALPAEATPGMDLPSLIVDNAPLPWTAQPIRFTAEVRHDRTIGPAAKAILDDSWPAKLVGWLLLTAMLPLTLSPAAARGLEKQSNAINLVMLLSLTAVPGLVAFAMLGFEVQGAEAAIVLILATALALLYNWVVLSKLEQLRV